MKGLYLDLNSPPRFNGSDMRCFDKGEKHITRTFDNDVLLLMLDGTLRFYENEKPIELKGREYYIQKSGLRQEGKLPSDMPKYLYIHFNGAFTDSNENSLPLYGYFDINSISGYIGKLSRSDISSSNTLVAKTGLFYSILDKINMQYMQEEGQNISAKRISDYIALHFTEQIKIKDMASALSYSEDHIIRSFRKSYHTTPHKYLTSLRMEYAKELLLTTERSVHRIAEDCGFIDLSVFYRGFFKYYGCTPFELKAKELGTAY